MDDDKDKPLTHKESKLLDEYLIDLNGTQAAVRAGYSEKTARVQASQILTKLNVRAELDRRLKDAALTPVEIAAALAAFVTGERCDDPRLAIKALELLARANGMFTDNIKLDANVDVKGYKNVSPDDWDAD